MSHDGGSTWTRSWAPFTFCSGGNVGNGGDFERASDPWVTFAPNGDAYQIALNFNGSDFVNAITVSKSTNGGDSWSPLTTLTREDGATNVSFVDKESITADPFDSSYVYAVWDRGRIPTDRTNINAPHAFSFRGDIWFSRTTNGGASWEPARAIFAPRESKFSIGNQIAVLPNGDLVDIIFLGHGSENQHGGWDVPVIRSTDRGVTWSSPIIVSHVQAVGVTDPETDRRSGPATSSRTSRSTRKRRPLRGLAGRTLQRVRGHRALEVDRRRPYLSEPVQVNQKPDVQAFTAAVEASSDGTVGVTSTTSATTPPTRPRSRPTTSSSTPTTAGRRSGTRST